MNNYSIFLIIILIFAQIHSEENDFKRTESLNKTAIISDTQLDVNRMNGIFRNNGTWFYDNVHGDWGLEWPKGSGKSPIFAAGQWVGAKFPDGSIRVAGVQHSATEYIPGQILESFTADDPSDRNYKWYELFSNNVGDWSNWPVRQGAPVDDKGNPDLLGDQTIFSVFNDLTNHSEFGTQPLSIEVQQTAFAFDRYTELGDMIFIKWRLVNKSDMDWDSTHITIWCDPDLGGAVDDLIGCDTSLGLGFCYNGDNDDEMYGQNPPAVGFDFFQGPVVDNPDSMVVLPDGTVLQGKEMLKMTSFISYMGSDWINGNPSSGSDVWNFMQAKWRNGQHITYGGWGTDPAAEQTNFMYSGDPEQATGWLDSQADDRRFIMTTGPFLMEAWEDINNNDIADFGEPGVQDIVACVMAAQGDNNLNSVTKLKQISKLAQAAYESNFQLAKAPVLSEEDVQFSENPNEIIITWNEKAEFNADGSSYSSVDPLLSLKIGDTVIVNNIIKIVDDDSYNFYGYTLYQYADPAGNDPVKIDHWDNGGTRDAEAYTQQRYRVIKKNHHPDFGEVGWPLVNGKEYYFGIVPEAYLEFGEPVVFAGTPVIKACVPRSTPGLRYHTEFNDTLNVTHTGNSDGSVVVWVIDPSAVTGKTYQVTFNEDITWNLIAEGDTIVKNQTNQTGDDAYNILDGLMIKVTGPDPGIDLDIPGPYGDYPGFTGYMTSGGTRWISWVTDWGLETMFGSLGNGYSLFGSDLSPNDYVDVDIRFAGCTNRSDTTSEGLMAASKLEYPERWQKAVVYRRDQGYAVQTTLGDIPMTVWDTENDRQLKAAFVEDATNGNANLIWDMGWDSADFADYGGYEYFFIINDTYDENYTEYLNGNLDGRINGVMYASGWGSRGYPYLYDAFQIQIYASNVNSTEDIFTFTAPPAAEIQSSTLKADLNKIRVVPNPYYGYHSGEQNRNDRWMQFTFIPENAVIRIFDLSGMLIRKIENTESNSLVKWDLKNGSGSPVASGIYIYYIEVPKVGKKTGKLAIFQSVY